jgi:hypothetical protein
MTRTNSGNTFYKNAKKKTNDSDDDDDSSSADGGDVNNGKADGTADGTAGTAFKPNSGHVAAVERTRGYTVESMPDYQRRVMHVVKSIQTYYPDLDAEVRSPQPLP